jgi:hypothetical protein
MMTAGGIVYGHLIDPIFVLVMEAKVTIHPKYFDHQVRNKTALFKKYVLFEAQQWYNFTAGWERGAEQIIDILCQAFR